jgi:TonB family protein
MSTNLKRAVVLMGLLAMGLAVAPPSAVAQESVTARTVTKRVAAVYPLMARERKLKGTVKLSLVVTPDGKVKSIGVIGGHPIFIVAASNAAKEWQFASAAKESNETLVFDFLSPQQ